MNKGLEEEQQFEGFIIQESGIWENSGGFGRGSNYRRRRYSNSISIASFNFDAGK